MHSHPVHIEQYRFNKNVADRLSKQEKPPLEWVVVINFYAALHLVESVLAEKGYNAKNHEDRKTYLSSVAELKRIRSYYLALQFQSEQARYECVRFRPPDVLQSQRHLENIERHIHL